MRTPSIAVLVPCYNEESTVAKVIDDFRKELPDAAVYVYDNASTDHTSEVARQHGAQVRYVARKGKAAVVRHMFRDIEADLYVLVDGDDTYPAEDIHKLIECVVENRADMAVGDRHSGGQYSKENTRPLHNSGNKLVRWLINTLFKTDLKDIMSGYRVFTRTFVKHCPILIDGFELEVSMTLHAVDRMYSIAEVPVDYRDRPEGSDSKLNTLQDGWRILRAIVWIFKDAKPFIFFLIASLIITMVSALIGIPFTMQFLGEGQPDQLLMVLLAALLLIIATVLMSCGLILDTAVKHAREQYELMLLNRRLSD